MEPSNISNGLAFDESGNLAVCEHATSSVVRETPDGERTTLASHYDGKELNSPNDIVVAPGGAIYFTDPPYGRFPGWGVEREQDMDYQGVFMITADGTLKLLVEDFEGPNGLCFAPDNSTLVHQRLRAGAHSRVRRSGRRDAHQRAYARREHRQRQPG